MTDEEGTRGSIDNPLAIHIYFGCRTRCTAT